MKGLIRIVTAALLMNASPVFSQSEKRVIEEIIVVAQKREQSLQDVPISVNAYSGELLDDAAITTITDLAERVPGFSVLESNRPATSTTISLRGIGTSGNDMGLEGAVGVFVNGIYRPRSGMGLSDLVDVDRVEILRGPQGTLFGKNTSAGAIVVETKNPGFERTEGFAEATFGNYGLKRYSGALNIPVSDELAFRFSGRLHERDGFIDDTITGAEYNDRDRYYVLGKMLFEPTDALSLLLTVDVSETDESCCQSVRFSNPEGSGAVQLLNTIASANGFAYPVDPTPTSHKTSINGTPLTQNDEIGVILELNWDLGGMDLVSITSSRKFESEQYNDVDFSGADLVRQGVFFDVDSISQEFRLTGSWEGIGQGVDWLFGAFYSEDDLDYYEPVDLGTDLEPFFTLAFGSATLGALHAQQDSAFGASAEQTAKAFAFFTHNIIQLTDNVEVVVGLRYTDEEKKTDTAPFYNHGYSTLPLAGLDFPFSPRHGYSRTFEDDAISGNLSFSYKWSEDIRTYVSYNRGFKSGGHIFNRDAAGPIWSRNPACSASGTIVDPGVPIYACDVKDPTFDSETVDSYEIGFRSRLADRSLQLNATYFYSEYEDLQLNSFDGFGFTVQNAGSATTQGLEVDVQWLTPIDGLMVETSFMYLDAKYGDEVGSLSGGAPPVGGEPLPRAPDWSGSLGGRYIRSLGDITLIVNGNYSYRDDSFGGTRVASDGSVLKHPSRETVDFSVGLEWANGFEVSAYCRNCTDEVEPILIFNSVVQSGSRDTFLTNPREWGITLGKSF